MNHQFHPQVQGMHRKLTHLTRIPIRRSTGPLQSSYHCTPLISHHLPPSYPPSLRLSFVPSFPIATPLRYMLQKWNKQVREMPCISYSLLQIINPIVTHLQSVAHSLLVSCSPAW